MTYYYGIFVQGVTAEIYSYEVALLIETFERTPLFGLGYRGSGDFHHLGSKERILCLHHALLITGAEPRQHIKEGLSLGIGSEILLSLYLALECVERTAQCQTFHAVAFYG